MNTVFLTIAMTDVFTLERGDVYTPVNLIDKRGNLKILPLLKFQGDLSKIKTDVYKEIDKFFETIEILESENNDL